MIFLGFHGASAAEITTILAGLAGGSIASGGWSMMAVCAAVVIAPVLVVGGLAWCVTSEIRQATVEQEYDNFVALLQGAGYAGPP